MSEWTRTTRRGLLAGAGIGLASMAGCASVDLPWAEEPSYDKATLDSLADREIPAVRDPITIEVPSDLIDRYSERAQELLAGVPRDPEIPNDMLESELAEDRDRVGDQLDSPLEGRTDLDRLSHARYRLASAINLNATYQAARGTLDLDSVRRERHRLRGDLYSFLESWDYLGPGPLEALVFHRHIERLVAEARRGTQPGRSLPDDPTDDPSRVGRVVGEIARGHAAVESANALRQRFIAGLDPPQAFRTPIITRASQAEHLHREFGHELDNYFEEHGRRRIDGQGSPAAFLFREASVNHNRARAGLERLRNREQFALAVIDAGQLIAARRAARRAAELVTAEQFPPPESASEVQREYDTAETALENAMGVTPRTISPVLARPAREYLSDGTRWLSETDRIPKSVYHAMAAFRFSRLFSESVPRAARVVASWFEE